MVILPKLFYGVSAWGGVVRFQSRLLPITRVLRQAAILTLGLLRTSSGTKALAYADGYLLTWRFALLWFGSSYGRRPLAVMIFCILDYVLGLNQRISVTDIARHEVTVFRTSGNHARLGWGHVDSLKCWVYPPWTIVPPVHIRLLERDSAL